MGNIGYRIVGGGMPIKVELIPSTIQPKIHTVVGTYTINNVPNGVYSLRFTDVNECIYELDVTVNQYITTTTTTSKTNRVIVGNVQDINLIFNVDGTNRDSKYIGSPIANDIDLYLWFKTADGKAMSGNKVINYNFTGVVGDIFTYDSVSDKKYTIVKQTTSNGVSLSGTLTMNSGFIETYFKYRYNRYTSNTNYTINLSSTSQIFYDGIPKISVTDPYGIVSITNTNINMSY